MFTKIFNTDKESREILLLEESQFRKAGIFGDQLISLLREKDDWIKDNTLTVFTNLKIVFNDPTIIAFNLFLQNLNRNNTVSIKIKLD